MIALHKAAQGALEALGHCREAIVERGLNGSEEFAAKWGLTLPLESSAKAINDLRTALAQEPDTKHNWTELALWWESGDENWSTLKGIVQKMITASQPAVQEPAQPKGLFIDLIDSLGPEFAAELKAMDVPAVQEPAQPVVLPREDSEQAQQEIAAMLREYDYPANPTNAARAGWRAARLFSNAALPAVQEPGLYRFRDSECCIKAMSGYLPPKDWTPLYAHQAPQPKRLTDEQIESAGARWIRDGHDWYGFARAIEAAVLGEKP